MDRIKKPEYKPLPGSAHYAFFDHIPGGPGANVSFSSFNAFCLALGIDLLAMGFKQYEITFLLKNIRPALQKEFIYIWKNPPAFRQRIPAEDRPNCPYYTVENVKIADCRVFAIIEKFEFKDMFPRHKGTGPIILQPEFCHGIHELYEHLHRMLGAFRKATVIELAYTGALVLRYLREAPTVSRGRR